MVNLCPVKAHVDLVGSGQLPSVHCVLQFTRKQERRSQRNATEFANEAFCFWLASSLGLPVDTWHLWAGSQTPSSSIEDGLWFEGNQSYIRPAVRSCYATWFSPEAHGSVCYEVIPSTWQSRVTNRDDFLGMVMFDAWAGAQRYRQAVYVSQPDQTMRALFLSHGQMFHISGKDGSIRYQPFGAGLDKLLVLHRHVLASWTETGVDHWARKLRDMDEHCIQQAFEYAYSSWQPDGWEENVSEYILRRYDDIAFIADALCTRLKELCQVP